MCLMLVGLRSCCRRRHPPLSQCSTTNALKTENTQPGLTGGWDSDVLRLAYNSLTTPASVIDHHIPSGRRALKKAQPVLGGFAASDYASERLWAAAADGARVPISLVYRRELFKKDGGAPMLLYG